MFLGENTHLFKRFCKRKDTIYVFNFMGFENKKIEKKPNKKKKRGKQKEKKEENNEEKKEEEKEKEKEQIDSIAIFKCDNEGCNAIYSYNFTSNRFTKREPHDDEVKHEIKEDVPEYYKQNIKLLQEKTYITDIQLVRDDN